MTDERYNELNEASDDFVKVTEQEFAEGWHFCAEFDCLLVGPGMHELNFCTCFPKEHPVYKTTPPQETGTIDATLL